MAKVVQVLVVVDLDVPIIIDELTAFLPDKRDDRSVVTFTEYGAPRLQRTGTNPQPVDWDRVGRAAEAIVRDSRVRAEGATLELYIGGQGPLPIFTHLGYAFSKFTGSQTFIGRHFGGKWEVLPVSGIPGTQELDQLSQRHGFRDDASAATGRVGIYVDTGGRPAPADGIRAALERRSENLAELVELRSSTALSLTPENSSSLARELARELPRLPSMYPHARGSALFVAGPTAFAFMVGRALNPTIERTLWLTNFSAGTYEFVYALPFVDRLQRALPREAEDEAARGKVRDALLVAIGRLQTDITDADLTSSLPAESRSKLVTRLKGLKYEHKRTDEFDLSLSTATFSFGDGLLEALRDADADSQGDFAVLLLLHEVFHGLQQHIRSTNYFDIGRAGVVLEHADFAADVFAVQTAVALEFRRLGVEGGSQAKTIATRWMNAVLFGIQRFDLLQHGERIEHLAERRLRRYLTWYIQLARAETVTTHANVSQLLDSVVTAELAPVAAIIDGRYDKEVVDAVASTELFVAVDGAIVRQGSRPGFDPGALVEAVRTYSAVALLKAAHLIIEEFRATLTPWVE
jgi:hypothetical protein